MGDKLQKKRGKRSGLALAGIFLLFAAPSPLATAQTAKNNSPTSQADAQALAHQLNDAGSDESLKNSATYAMQALLDLGNSRLPSAMNNGYQAYGKYRNAENLDMLKDQNTANANSLASVGSAPVIQAPVKTNTSFRRLDPSFLKEGQYAKVAAEFERQTGMSRADFLKEMSNASEKKISRFDPMMVDKALSRFEGFLQKIPSAEFRKKAEANVAKVPQTMRKGIVAQAVSKLATFFADTGSSAKVPPLAAPALPAPTAPSLASNAAPAAPATEPITAEVSNERKPAALGATAVPVEITGTGSPSFGNVVEAALETQGQDSQIPGGEATIFQQVTKRYRALTPSITKL